MEQKLMKQRELLEDIIKMEYLKQEYYKALEQVSSCKGKTFGERMKLLRHYIKTTKKLHRHAKTMEKR